MTEIFAAVNSLKSAYDVLKALHSLKVTGEVQAKLTEIGGYLMEAQAAALEAQLNQQTMAARIREFESELVKLENWEAEKQRYHLEETTPGSFAYAIKESVRSVEPPHKICPHCYQEKTKSILHRSAQGDLKCHRCKLLVHMPRPPKEPDEPLYAI